MLNLRLNMKVLGISCFYHDAAAAIIEDGRIVAAAQEERFTRKKHDPDFPKNAIRYCLDAANCTIDELDAIAFYDKPFLKFERLLESYYAYAPRGLRSFIASMPIWLKEKMFIKRLIYDELKEVEEYDKKGLKLLFPEHHLSHAASAFYPSEFEDAAILTIDGVGEWATGSICHGVGKDITIIKEQHFPHSIGLLYSAFTYYLGFRVNSGEYKLMGLAPYGDPHSERTKKYIDLIKSHLIDIKEDGSIWMDQKYFNYATGLRMAKDKKWKELFGLPRRDAETDIEQQHCDMAYAIQYVTEEVVLLQAKEAKRVTGAQYLCMAGGVALNCVANGKLIEAGVFDKVFIQPAAGDAGGALGAALAAYHIYFEKDREVVSPDAMRGSYLGPDHSDAETERMLRQFSPVMHKQATTAELSEQVAKLLAQGDVVGWCQGPMEFGPRALGARSILGDPRNEEMQKKLNLKIKYRESFRPFAPAVLESHAKEYFNMEGTSPYMLQVHQVANRIKKDLPTDYASLNLRDKLYHLRSDLPAVTHVDMSARIQTVNADTNKPFADLLEAFHKQTGCPVLVNTSFNVRGEPIVMTPEDAYRCFMRTEMDHLVVGNYIFHKNEQPPWPEDVEWRTEFKLD